MSNNITQISTASGWLLKFGNAFAKQARVGHRYPCQCTCAAKAAEGRVEPDAAVNVMVW